MLADEFPHLAKEADGWDPREYKSGSGKKMPWVGVCGHQWTAAIFARAKNGSGCPICSGQQVLVGFNDLLTRYPELAAEADDWDPSTVYFRSKRRLAWKCAFEHRWETSVAHRVSGSRCPVCMKRKTLSGVNDLATLFPDLAREATNWDPTQVAPSDKRKFEWKCASGHVWTASVYPRTKGVGCPVCAGKRALSGLNDLATTHPHLAAEAVGWDPSTVIGAANQKLLWRCPQGHEYLMRISDRKQGNNCAVCSGKQVMRGVNDLASTHSAIAAQALDWDPTKVTAHSNKRFGWRCDQGHEWTASVQARTSGRGCPMCSRRTLKPGVNDLATRFPQIAAEANGWDPKSVLSGSSQRVSWKCHRGHTWMAAISTRTSQGSQCPKCIGRTVEPGETDLRTQFPLIAAEADGWDASQVLFGSHARKPWICQHGHRWVAVVASRTRQGTGCPVCANLQLLPGFNDLATTHPLIAAEAHEWDPRTVVAGSNAKKEWVCSAGHTWTASPNKRTSGRGCPSCSKTGFDPNADAWLYLLEHDNWDLHQIGISNSPVDRTALHQRRGWTLQDLRGPMLGEVAHAWEQSILAMLRAKRIQVGETSHVGSFDGFTESWPKRHYAVTSIRELLRAVEDWEDEIDRDIT